MPTTFIPAGDFVYDTGYFGNPANFVDVLGASPFGRRFVSGLKFYTNSAWTNVGTTAAYAQFNATMHLHNSATLGNPIIYVSDGVGNIFRVQNGLTTKTTEASGLTSGLKGNFTSYGDFVIYTNGTDEIKSIVDANFGSTTFAKNNVITTPDSHDPKARFVTTLKNHLLIADVDLTGVSSTNRPAALAAQRYSDLIWWSKTDDTSRFGTVTDTPTITGSGYLFISDNHGPITGVSGGDFALIFKDRAVYRIDGPPFNSTAIVYGAGTIYPRSIVKLYSDTFFWSENGPAVIRANGDFQYLTADKVSRLIEDSGYLFGTQSDRSDIIGATSHKRNSINWYAVPSSTAPEAPVFCKFGLEYNDSDQRFTRTYNNGGSIAINDTGAALSGQVIAIEGTSNYSPQSSTPGSEFFGVAYQAFDPITYNYKVVRGMRNINYAANVQTNTPTIFIYPLIKLSGDSATKLTKIKRIRPVWKYHYPVESPVSPPDIESVTHVTFSINIISSDNQFASTNWGLATRVYNNATAEGWYTIPDGQLAHYHAIKISCTMPSFYSGDKIVSNEVFASDEGFVGIEIEYDESSLRS